MSYQVIVFSTDRIRGGILKKVLQDDKIKILLVAGIIDLETAISSHDPGVVILDTHDTIKSEAVYLKKLSCAIKNRVIFFLGDAAALETFSKDAHCPMVLFPDPFAPERITAKSREILASILPDPDNQNNGSKKDANTIENDIKKYLNLE